MEEEERKKKKEKRKEEEEEEEERKKKMAVGPTKMPCVTILVQHSEKVNPLIILV